MKYGFFGGSFNPPTKAHLEIARNALDKFKLDEVFLVPMGNGYNKPDLIDEKYRYEMLKLLLKNEEKIDVEAIELKRKEKLSAINAFKLIEEKYYNSENYFIMGADNLIKIPNWNDSENLIKNYRYIVFERDNINLEEFINKNYILKEHRNNVNILRLNENPNCRSGIVRNMIKNGNIDNINDFIDKNVEKYIEKNQLYKNH